MTLLTYTTFKQLSPADIERILQLLEIEDASIFDAFQEKPDDEQDFYTLYRLLADQPGQYTISTDWRWDPEEIILQLAEALPSHKIELVEVDEDLEGFYSVDVRIDGDRHVCDAYSDYPQELVQTVERLASDSTFIEVYFADDSYNWLRLPRGFSDNKLKELCDMTGCQLTEQDQQQRPQRPQKPSIKLKGRQAAKIFFVPKIQVITSQKGWAAPSEWAGRILPGQTIEEGIATELKQVYKYTGKFEFGRISFLDYAKDRRGMDIERYSIHITLRPADGNILEYLQVPKSWY